MSILEKAASFLGDEEEGQVASLWQILGPLFVLCAYSLAPRDPAILGVGVLGLFLSARWQIRGLSYALALLGIVAIAEHAFLTDRHLWQLGLEASYAIAFFITALSAEGRSHFVQSLSGQLDAREASILNLEEDLAKAREEAALQQIALQEKIDALQKQWEEGQSELSSLLILNEVLRSTSAVQSGEKEAAGEELLGAQRKMSLLLEEIEGLQKEAARLSDGNALALENRDLSAQLNSARFGREQARLISETLAREHAKENLKAREASEQYLSCLDENRRLKRQFSSLQHEAEALDARMEQTGAERERHRLASLKMEEVQTERNFLRERLAKAELELAQRKEPVAPEEIAHMQEKISSLAGVEALYKQLRAQFEEKNGILHQTRAELFRADTQLQTLKMEKEQRELQANPISEEMRREIGTLEEERAHLERENEELQCLVTLLSAPPQSEKKK